jgi:hypothetical protein
MEREGKAAGSRVAVAHVGCSVCCVLCFFGGGGGEQPLATILKESQYWPRQNGRLLCNHIMKSAPPKIQALIGQQN